MIDRHFRDCNIAQSPEQGQYRGFGVGTALVCELGHSILESP